MNMLEQLEKLKADATAICDLAEKEKRDLTADERSQIKRMLDDGIELKKKIKQEQDDAKANADLRRTILEMDAGLSLTQAPKAQEPAVPAGKGKALGERFVNSPEFSTWMKQVAPSGRVPDSGGLVSPPVAMPALLKSLLGRKELITGLSDASAGGFVETDYTRLLAEIGRHPLVLRDLIDVRTTTSDLVHFVRQTVQVTQATTVPEANVTEYSGATGEISGEKPEGILRWTPVTTPVKTIAVWIPATRRALSDVAQLRGLIDSELRADCDEELESQMMTGNNIGENFQGVLNTPGVLTQAFNTDMLVTIRQAKTTLAVTGRERMPTGIVMHPNDAEALDLLRDGNNNFYFGGPIDGGVQRVWRVPVIESVFMTEGQSVMGNWRRATLWDREDSTIRVSDSHEDFFIRNMIAILCELRAAWALIRPPSFIIIDLEEGS